MADLTNIAASSSHPSQADTHHGPHFQSGFACFPGPSHRAAMTGTIPDMRILGLDLGERRVGVALSDSLGYTAQPQPTLEVGGDKALLEAIRKIIQDYEVSRIVVGLPLNQDGTMGPRALRVEQLANQMAVATGLPVERIDERFTSIEAQRILKDAPRKVRRDKGNVDRIAATLILQNYLDSQRYS
jgi:putative holliday junction resolvase